MKTRSGLLGIAVLASVVLIGGSLLLQGSNASTADSEGLAMASRRVLLQRALRAH